MNKQTYTPSRLDFTVMDSRVVPLSTSNALLWEMFSKLVPLTSSIWSPLFKPPS